MLRRWLRRVFYLLTGLVALILVAIVALLIVLSTPWGKERLGDLAESQMRAALVGGGSVGRIEGSVLGDLVVHDIVINDASGQAAIVIERARINARILPLFRKIVHLDELEISGMQVRVRQDREGPINLATLLVASDRPSTVQFIVDEFTVANSSITLTRPGHATETLESLEIGASSLAYSAAGLKLSLGPTMARHRERQVDLGLEASVSLRDGRISVRNLVASVAGARLDLKSARIENSELREVRGNISVPAGSVHALVPGALWRADTMLHLESEGAELQLGGTIGDAAVTGRLTPVLARGEAALLLDLSQVDLGSLWPGLPASELDLSLTAALASAASQATLTARGTVLGKDIDAASLSLDLRGDKLQAKAQARGVGASLIADAEIELGESLTIRTSRGELVSNDLSKLVSPWLDLRGDVHAQWTAQGAIDSLVVRGSVTSSRLKTRGMTVTGLRVAAHSEDGRRAKVAVSATQGEAAIRLNATLTWSPESLGVELSSASARYREVKMQGARGRGRWSFSGPRAGLVKIDDLRLESNVGNLSLSGELGNSAQPTRGSIKLHATQIDLSVLSRVAELETPLAGILSMTATIDTRQGKRVDIAVHADGVTGRELPASTGDLTLRLRGREWLATLKATMPGIAQVKLDAKLRGPRRPLDLDRWMNLDPSSLLSLEAGVEVSDLAAFSHLHPELPQTGRLELHATQHEGETKTLVDLRGSNIVSRRFDEPAHVSAHLDLEDQRIAGSGEVGLGERASAIVVGAVHMGGPWFASHSYRRLGVDAIEEAKVSTSDVDLDWLLKRVAPSIGATGALARASFICLSTKKSCELAATVTLPRGGPLRRQVAQKATINATMDEHHSDAGIVASVNAQKKLEGSGELDLGWRDLLAGRRDFRATAAKATLAIRELPLRTLRELWPGGVPAALDAGLSGRLSASATFSGTVNTPLFWGHAAIDGLAVDGVAIASLVADGEFREGQVTVSASGAQAGGGSLKIRARSDLRTMEPAKVSAQIVAKRLDLAFLGKLSPGSDIGGLLSAQLEVAGSRKKPMVIGTATLSKGSFNPGPPFYSIKNADIVAELSPEQILVRADVESGGGKGKIRGTIDLSGNAPTGVKLSMVTDDLPINASTLLMRLDSATTVSGSYEGDTWQLSAMVERATLNLPDALSRSLHPVALPTDLILSDELKIKRHEPGKPLVPTAIEIAIRSKKSILVKGGGVTALLGVELDVHLDDELNVRGTVRADQGRIEFMGRRYELKTGEATFSGDLDPSINVELAHEFDALTLFIDVSGPVSKPVVGFRSEPARYDTAELLAFVLGASPDELAAGSRSSAEQATGVATSLIAGQLSRVVTDVVPIDLLQLDTADSSPERVALGKWLTDRLLVAYRHRFTTDPNFNTNELIFEYRFLERWLLEGYIGDVEIGADLLWIKRY